MECLALCQTEVKVSSRSSLLFERYVKFVCTYCVCRGQNALCPAEHLTVNVTWEIQQTPTQTSFPHSREPTTYSLILVKKTYKKTLQAFQHINCLLCMTHSGYLTKVLNDDFYKIGIVQASNVWTKHVYRLGHQKTNLFYFLLHN